MVLCIVVKFFEFCLISVSRLVRHRALPPPPAQTPRAATWNHTNRSNTLAQDKCHPTACAFISPMLRIAMPTAFRSVRPSNCTSHLSHIIALYTVLVDGLDTCIIHNHFHPHHHPRHHHPRHCASRTSRIVRILHPPASWPAGGPRSWKRTTFCWCALETTPACRVTSSPKLCSSSSSSCDQRCSAAVAVLLCVMQAVVCWMEMARGGWVS